MLNYFVSILYLAITIFYQISGFNYSVVDREDLICNSTTCKEIAYHLESCVDSSLDPCDNFYEFSCARWKSENEIPSYYGEYGTNAQVEETVAEQLKEILGEGDEDEDEDENSSEAIILAKRFYRNCLIKGRHNNSNAQDLGDFFNQFGLWPVLNKDYDDNLFDVTTLLGRLGQELGDEYFFQLQVNPDVKGEKIYKLTIEQMILCLGDGTRDYYLNETKYKLQMDAYKGLIIDIVHIVAQDLNISNIDYSQVDELIQFEKHLAAITIPDETIRNQSLTYNVWTLTRLAETVPYINWTRYFDMIFPDQIKQKQEYTNFNFIVTKPQYLKDLQVVLTTANKRIVISYIFWKFICGWIDMLDSRFSEANQKFNAIFSGTTKDIGQKGFCYTKVTDAMPTATGAMYVRKHFSSLSKSVANLMVLHLKFAFQEMIQELDWMDTETKSVAIEKLYLMREYIGYPEFMKNDTALDEEYKNLNFSEDDSFFIVNQKVYSFAYKKNLNYLFKPVDLKLFETSPAVVNAFYVKETNSLRYMAAALQFPFFNINFPLYVNFGSTGSIMGHEITHGFDDDGSQYDWNGNLNNWWSNFSRKTFMEKTKCLIDQYNQYMLPDTNLHVNGELTLNENIADLGGLKAAIKAYKNWRNSTRGEELYLPGFARFTPEQMIFINYANFYCENRSPASALEQVLTDNHSPSLFRVNGVLVNLDEFSSAFNCPIGSKMNPDPKNFEKCSVW